MEDELRPHSTSGSDKGMLSNFVVVLRIRLANEVWLFVIAINESVDLVIEV
jgi:hypothetical protein